MFSIYHFAPDPSREQVYLIKVDICILSCSRRKLCRFNHKRRGDATARKDTKYYLFYFGGFLTALRNKVY